MLLDETVRRRLRYFMAAVELFIWFVMLLCAFMFASFVSYQWGYESRGRGEPPLFQDWSE